MFCVPNDDGDGDDDKNGGGSRHDGIPLSNTVIIVMTGVVGAARTARTARSARSARSTWPAEDSEKCCPRCHFPALPTEAGGGRPRRGNRAANAARFPLAGGWRGEPRQRKGPCQAHALRPACRAKRSVLHLPQRGGNHRASDAMVSSGSVGGHPVNGRHAESGCGGGVLPRRSGCGATSPTNALCRAQRGRVAWLCHLPLKNRTRGHVWGHVASDEGAEFSAFLVTASLRDAKSVQLGLSCQRWALLFPDIQFACQPPCQLEPCDEAVD